jgi:uncharacterized membrane protein (UPF0136 family)
MISAVVTLAGIGVVTSVETATGVETTATVEQMGATLAGLVGVTRKTVDVAVVAATFLADLVGVGVTRGPGTGVEVAMTTVADLTWQWQCNTRNNPTL